MRPLAPIALAGAATLALALPAASQARHGADDAAGHEHHGSAGVHQRHDGRDDRRTAAERATRRAERHHRRHAHHEAGDDHGRRHGGHGADD